MSNSTDQTLDDESIPSYRSPNNQLREEQQQAQEWETLARAWVSAFPEAKAVNVSQVEVWIDSNFGSLPAELQSMPRAELIDRLLSIQNHLRFPSQPQEKEPSQPDLLPARFQRTDQWIPVYSWLESLDMDEVVKSKDISDWLNENPQVKDQLCSRHSRYHLMHYIKKCHLKIIKRKEKKAGLQPLNKETALKVRKDAVAKKPAPVLSNPLNNLPKDSDLYVAKRNEAFRKYEIVGEEAFPHVFKEEMKENLRRVKSTMIRLLHECLNFDLAAHAWHGDGVQPLSKIAIHKAVFEIHENASVKAQPVVLGTKGGDSDWVTVAIECPKHSEDDWIAVFSPANFNSSSCPSTDEMQEFPYICSAPIKYKYANDSNADYKKTGKASLKFQLINQRADFSFALFSGGLSDPKLVAVSNVISFVNPKASLYPRLSQGQSWNEMTVTWTSGYNIIEAVPFVEWGLKGESQTRSPAGTLTFHRNSMCALPARTVGWRDPGFIHTSFLKEAKLAYTYKLGHKLLNGSYVWSKSYSFKSSPYPGQDSLQRVVIFGDIGKAERDGSNEYSNYQPGSLNTTDQIIKDLENIDIVFHIGDIAYANGYISQWDQFTSQVEPIASAVPYMIASGNHERDSPNSGSFFDGNDSGGECGVLAETMFYVPAENRAKFWYSTDHGMFHFCIADSEHDWREGSEQYKFIEKCLASADRQKQPWLIFVAHRVLGYSSYYWEDGTFGETMGRESLQGLWQKYKVDIAFFGHIHNYERTCPVYQAQCMNMETSHYSGTVNGTIHIVVGGGGSHLSKFGPIQTSWSLYRDVDFGFVKLTAFNHSSAVRVQEEQRWESIRFIHYFHYFQGLSGCLSLRS